MVTIASWVGALPWPGPTTWSTLRWGNLITGDTVRTHEKEKTFTKSMWDKIRRNHLEWVQGNSQLIRIFMGYLHPNISYQLVFPDFVRQLYRGFEMEMWWIFFCWCSDIGSTFRQRSSERWTPKVFLQRLAWGRCLLVFLDDLSKLIVVMNIGLISKRWEFGMLQHDLKFKFSWFSVSKVHSAYLTCTICSVHHWTLVLDAGTTTITGASLLRKSWHVGHPFKKHLRENCAALLQLVKRHLSFPESKVSVCLVGWYLSWSGNLEHRIRKSKSSKVGFVCVLNFFWSWNEKCCEM